MTNNISESSARPHNLDKDGYVWRQRTHKIDMKKFGAKVRKHKYYHAVKIKKRLKHRRLTDKILVPSHQRQGCAFSDSPGKPSQRSSHPSLGQAP